jgi:hypothetical protein
LVEIGRTGGLSGKSQAGFVSGDYAESGQTPAPGKKIFRISGSIKNIFKIVFGKCHEELYRCFSDAFYFS